MRRTPGRSITQRALTRAGDRYTPRPKATNSRTKGMDMTWGCRSPRRKLKKGNSVMV